MGSGNLHALPASSTTSSSLSPRGSATAFRKHGRMPPHVWVSIAHARPARAGPADARSAVGASWRPACAGSVTSTPMSHTVRLGCSRQHAAIARPPGCPSNLSHEQRRGRLTAAPGRTCATSRLAEPRRSAGVCGTTAAPGSARGVGAHLCAGLHRGSAWSCCRSRADMDGPGPTSKSRRHLMTTARAWCKGMRTAAARSPRMRDPSPERHCAHGAELPRVRARILRSGNRTEQLAGWSVGWLVV